MIVKYLDKQKATIKEIDFQNEKKEIAKLVLDNLPDWFGIPENTRNYIEKSSQMPFLAIYVDDITVGFVSLKGTSEFASEIFCMGILKEYHHKGLGSLLYYELESYAKRLGYKYIQVKTVQSGHYIEYDKTNSFYKSVGFCELEVFPTLWDERNPCQVYVKAI